MAEQLRHLNDSRITVYHGIDNFYRSDCDAFNGSEQQRGDCACSGRQIRKDARPFYHDRLLSVK